MYEFAHLVETSSNAGVSKARLVGTHDGRVIVPDYDWLSFLPNCFKTLQNIKKFHHFRFSKESPGVVFCKEFVSSPEEPFTSLKNRNLFPPLTLPPTTEPVGLTEGRKRYVFYEIRLFCKCGTEDIVTLAP